MRLVVEEGATTRRGACRVQRCAAPLCRPEQRDDKAWRALARPGTLCVVVEQGAERDRLLGSAVFPRRSFPPEGMAVAGRTC